MDLLKITYTDIYIRQTSHGHYMHGATRERERERDREIERLRDREVER